MTVAPRVHERGPVRSRAEHHPRSRAMGSILRTILSPGAFSTHAGVTRIGTSSLTSSSPSIAAGIVSNSVMRPPGADKEIPSHTHSFDAGTASSYLALQANKIGWHVHGMIGFDLERAFADLNVPVGYRVEAPYAIAKKGVPAQLPEGARATERPHATRQGRLRRQISGQVMRKPREPTATCARSADQACGHRPVSGDAGRRRRRLPRLA